ncbi:MAG: glycosyltransferase family 2 protein [Anaerolineae bacterium]|nr:glycosyltransferase family 2 protein [Anaerolineae bacterium]
MLDLSIIIVNWNTHQLLSDCLGSIQATAEDIQVEVIVIDNGSTDGSQAVIREHYPAIRLIENTDNPGFAGANNQGMAQAQGRYFLLLNSDTLVKPGTLQQALQFMDHTPEAGMCGVKLLNPDGTFQASYANFPTLKAEFLTATGLGPRLISPYYPSPRPQSSNQPHEVDWIAGAFMLLRREVYEALGGMDTSYWMYSEETDWCYHIKRAGYKIYYLPEAAIIHIGGASTRQRRPQMRVQLVTSKLRFFAKNYGPHRTRQLRLLLWSVYLGREFASRLLMLMASGARKAHWQSEIQNSRLVRAVCMQPLTPAPQRGYAL